MLKTIAIGLCCAIVASGCSKSGEQFVGYWQNAKDANTQIEIDHDKGNIYRVKMYYLKAPWKPNYPYKIMNDLAENIDGALVVDAGTINQRKLVILRDGSMSFANEDTYYRQKPEAIAANKKAFADASGAGKNPFN